MSDLYQRRVARIAVTTAKDAYVGAGFALDDRHVLTCAHLLEDATQIHVTFPHSKRRATATVAWRAVDLDGALLRLSEVQPLTPFPLHHGTFAEGARWIAYGFPEIGQGGSSDEPVPFTGNAQAIVDNHLHLVDDAPTANLADSQGASGAAVIIGGSVCGVIVKKPTGFLGKKIHVTAMPALLDQDEFRKILGVGRFFDGTDAELRDLITEHMVNILKSNQDAAEQLWQQEPLHSDPMHSDPVEKRTDRALADLLLSLPVDKFLEVMLRARSRLVGIRVVTKRPAAAAALAELMTWAAPALVPPQVVAHASTWKPGLTPLPIQYGTAAMAEVLMAALEGRPCAFADATGASDAPGESCVYFPDKTRESLDPDSQNFMNLFRDVLIAHLDLSRVPLALQDERINSILDPYRADPDHPTRYMLILPEAGDAEQRRTRLAEIADRYPSLVILALDPTRYREECRTMLEPILKLRSRPE